jgi:diguanylate cyclase (GGDEF)-like protein
MLGKTADELIGQTGDQVFAHWRELMQQFRTAWYLQTELYIQDSDQYLDVSMSVLHNQRRRILGRLVIVRDITDRKHAEQEIHRRLAELSTLNAVSQIAASTRDVNQLVETVGDKLREILNVQGVYIGLYDASTNQFHVPYWRIGQERLASPAVLLKDSLSAYVLNTRQPLVINSDYERRSAEIGVVRVKASAGLPKAWLGVPMLMGDQPIGVLSAAHYEKENVFTTADIQLWTTIAANLAIAIRNAQLHNETQQYAEQMATLNRISFAITQDLALERISQTLHQQCSQFAPIDVFYVALCDSKTGKIPVVYFAEQGTPRENLILDLKTHPGITGYVIQTRRTLSIADTLDPAQLPVQMMRAGGTPARSYVGVPMILHDQVIGVISMQSYQPNAYTPQQIHLLELVAVQAAVAIANAQLHEQVQQLAITDDLTGLFNRRTLFQRGQDEINRARRFGRPLTAVMLDIDHFKNVNDTYTHAAGDNVLRIIGELCRRDLRNTDLAARYGGEEFALLLPETDEPTALLVVERLRHDIASTPMTIDDVHTIHITVSAGIAALDANLTTFDDLIHCADIALYSAKQNGRNQTCLWSKHK